MFYFIGRSKKKTQQSRNAHFLSLIIKTADIIELILSSGENERLQFTLNNAVTEILSIHGFCFKSLICHHNHGVTSLLLLMQYTHDRHVSSFNKPNHIACYRLRYMTNVYSIS